MSTVHHPTHYNVTCSTTGREYLSILGFKPEDFKLECIEALEQRHQWVLRDAYVFNAVKYLWRLGEKGEHDFEKAVWYLERWAIGPTAYYMATGNKTKVHMLLERMTCN